MYSQAILSIDPSQLTHLDQVKPTKGFARIAHFLTAGMASSQEERETFCAITILQQVNLVMRSVGIDNIIRLAKDDTVFYEDTQGEKDDLKKALEQFATRIDADDAKSFNTLNLVLEHHTDELACLIDIRILRTHAIGQHPIQITVNGLSKKLDAGKDEDTVRTKLALIFSSQSNYDSFVAQHKKEFASLLDNLEAAFHKHMHVDSVIVNASLKLIRPK